MSASRKGSLLWLTLCTLMGLACNPAQAHEQSVSHSRWNFDGPTVSASLSHRPVDLARVPSLARSADPQIRGPAISRYLQARLRVRSKAGPCQPQRASSRAVGNGWESTLSWRCPQAGGFTIEYSALFDVLPGHVHMARTTGGGRRALRRDAARWTVSEQAPESGSFFSYLSLGVVHILGGWDHLCFLLALILLATKLGEVAWLITGFTLAHSVTLALAVLGYVLPDPRVVEWLIALSIVVLAIENLSSSEKQHSPAPLIFMGLVLAAGFFTPAPGPLVAAGIGLFVLAWFTWLRRWPVEPRLRMLLSFAFGLFHGFGFAGVLREMSIPPADLPASLLAFNIGVELGQLGVLLIAWPLLRLAGRHQPAALAAINAGVGGVAVYWLVLRSAG